MIGERLREADAGSGGIARRLDIGDDEPRLRRNLKIGAVAHELPHIRPEKPLMDDAIVPSEILGRLGRTAGLEIGGAGAHDATDGADPQRDQSAVGEFAGPERHIDMFVRQAEDSVPEQQTHVDLGIGPQELGQDRDEI